MGKSSKTNNIPRLCGADREIERLETLRFQKTPKKSRVLQRLHIKKGSRASLDSKIKQLSDAIANAQRELEKIRRRRDKQKGIQFNPIVETIPHEHYDFVIECDGGIIANEAYGSFLIKRNEKTSSVHRISLGDGLCSNSAEIYIIYHALDYLLNGLRKRGIDPYSMKILVRSDSKYGLHWTNPNTTGKPCDQMNEKLKEAIQSVRTLNKSFGQLDTEWRSRKISVALFGH